MSKFQEDFVNDQGIEFETNSRKFLLREPLGDEIDSIIDQCIKIEEVDGVTSVKEDLVKRTRLLMQAVVVDAPYEKDGKPFRQLTKDEQYNILNRLKIGIRGPLRNKVLELSGMKKGDDASKKSKRS